MKARKFLLVLFLFLCICCGIVFGTPVKEQVLKLLYPIQYTDLVEREAEAYGLDPALVYAVIRTESGFDPEARSHAGAMGLMQMTEETFVWMQEILGESGAYGPEDLYDPQISIRYGCAFLSRLIGHYGRIETALCAYNAGMGNVASWLSDPLYSSDGVTVDLIPFEETRNYVQKVLQAESMYRELYQL